MTGVRKRARRSSPPPKPEPRRATVVPHVLPPTLPAEETPKQTKQPTKKPTHDRHLTDSTIWAMGTARVGMVAKPRGIAVVVSDIDARLGRATCWPLFEGLPDEEMPMIMKPSKLSPVPDVEFATVTTNRMQLIAQSRTMDNVDKSLEFRIMYNTQETITNIQKKARAFLRSRAITRIFMISQPVQPEILKMLGISAMSRTRTVAYKTGDIGVFDDMLGSGWDVILSEDYGCTEFIRSFRVWVGRDMSYIKGSFVKGMTGGTVRPEHYREDIKICLAACTEAQVE